MTRISFRIGMTRVLALGLAAGLLFASERAAAVGATAGQKGKPVNLAASAAFGDGASDAITSDGAAYVEGAGGLVVELLSGGQFSLIARGTSRRVNYDLTARISGTGFTGTLSDDSNIAVNNLTGMAVGATIATRAIFNTSIGQLTFDSAADSLTSSVIVTRESVTTWTVQTSMGDVAVLVQPDPRKPNRTIKVGYYHLPFTLTVVAQ